MSENDTERAPYKNPRPRREVADRWIEEYDNPEFRVVELEGWRDLYAVATVWDQDSGLPIEDATWWHGRKGEFFSLWHAIIKFADREHPELIADLADEIDEAYGTETDQ